ncbi:MAG: hypothetical protein OXN17_17455 [Candidatus Poribacteria bacterium]|nr:hypothetical protein [Candidatus Poribacteria bacterium]
MSNKMKHSLLASSTEATSLSAEIATKKNSEEWEATHELFDDPEFLASLERSIRDFEAGNIFDWEDIKRDV